MGFILPVEYRKHQEIAVGKVSQSFKAGHKKVLLEAPPGFGKSVVIENTSFAFADIEQDTLILCDRRQVIDQLTKRAAGNPRIHVMTVHAADALFKAGKLPTGIRYVAVDEAHQGGAGERYGRILDNYPDARKLFLTGTPSPALMDLVDDHIVSHDAAWLTEKGFLAPLKYCLAGAVNLKGVRTQKSDDGGRDYVLSELAKLVNKRAICGNAISIYKTHCLGKSTLIFCTTIKHAEDVATQFREAGVACETLTSKDSKKETARKIAFLVNGGLLITVDRVSAGFDLPNLHAIISLRPTMSPRVWVQQMGRAARAADGKLAGYVFDLVGNTWRLGTFTKKRTWREEEDEEAKKDTTSVDGEDLNIRSCDSCYFTFESGPICPECGHDNGKDRRISVREQERLDFIEAERIEKERKRLIALKKKRVREANSLAELVAIGREYNHKPGWAQIQWKLKEKRRKQQPPAPRYSADGWPL